MPIAVNLVERTFIRIERYKPGILSKVRSYGFYNGNLVALTDKVFENTLEWVNGADQNFFLFVNLMEQHYVRYFGRPEGEGNVIGPKYYSEDPEQAYLRPETMVGKNKKLLEWHKETIKFVDFHLGKFLEDLKKLDIYDSSTIIVTSDHGNMFGEFGHYNHQDCLQYPNVFVPFIIKYAESENDKKINPDRIFQQTDVFAEILDLYDIPNPSYSYGVPFEAEEGNPVINQLYYFKFFVGVVKEICVVHV